jgi:hypothetical protein
MCLYRYSGSCKVVGWRGGGEREGAREGGRDGGTEGGRRWVGGQEGGRDGGREVWREVMEFSYSPGHGNYKFVKFL